MTALTHTFTATRTITIARLDLIKLQVRIAVRRSSRFSVRSSQALERGFDRQWINTVNIYGLDDKNFCRAQLSLEINWDQHNFHLSQGKVMVAIEGWVDNTAIELDEVIKLFNRYVRTNKLYTIWSIVYLPDLNRDEINRELGFRPMDLVWSSEGSLSTEIEIPEMSELRIGLRLIE